MYTEAVSLWTPKAKENDIDTPLLGSAPLYWNAFSEFYQTNNNYLSDKIEAVGSSILMTLILFGVGAFEEGYLKLNSKKYRLITALNESEKVRSGRR